MKREESRFAESNIFEGMISFRAIINGIENSITDRHIIKVIYDKEREKKLSGHLSYIKAMSYKHDFEVFPVKSAEIDEVAIGASHGGIITYCTDRNFPSLSVENIVKGGVGKRICKFRTEIIDDKKIAFKIFVGSNRHIDL